MTVTTTYLPDLSRVRVAYSSAPTGTDYALVERSLDGITWSTVRGGEQVLPTASAGSIDDYEFTPGVSNTYRVSYVDTGAISMVGTPGVTATGNNATLVPALPVSGLLEGDLLLCFASIRNSGAGTPNTPAGWTKLVDMANACLFGKRYLPGDTAPSVSFTGGVVNADTLAQVTSFHNAELQPITQNQVLNGSAQNVTLPAASFTQQFTLDLFLAWKQDDWTGAADARAFAEIGDWFSTAGDDAAMWWEYTVQGASDIDFGTATLTVTGGAAAISRGATVIFRPADYLRRETQAITPSLQDVTGTERVWVKNLQRPYMNTALSTPVGELVIEEEARAGVFPIKGRSLPVAVTDLRGGQSYTIGALVTDSAERDRLKQVLKAGEPILLHIPVGIIRLRSMYAVIGKTSYDDEASILWMPLSEVAAPAASIVGTTVLWQDIVSTYATWADLIAAKATWSDVLASVGSPTDIITG